MKQLMYMWINSLVNKSEYYMNRLVYTFLSKAKFYLTILLWGRTWGESPLYLLLVSRVLKRTFLINTF